MLPAQIKRKGKYFEWLWEGFSYEPCTIHEGDKKIKGYQIVYRVNGELRPIVQKKTMSEVNKWFGVGDAR